MNEQHSWVQPQCTPYSSVISYKPAYITCEGYQSALWCSTLYSCIALSLLWIILLEHREWCCFPIMPPLNLVAWGCGLLWFFYLLLKLTSIWISCNENGLKFSFPLFICGNLTLCNCYLFLEGKLYWPPLDNNFFPSSMLFW